MNDRTRTSVLTRTAALVGAVWLCTTGATWMAAQTAVPQLEVEAPGALDAVAERVRGFDPGRLLAILRLTGLREPGPPIRIVLVPEDSPVAGRSPSWVAGFADVERNVAVLFPQRIGTYPYRTLEEVLFHEVSHLLVGRAAAGRPIPRWFDEGLASAAEHSWGIEERSRFAWQALTRGRVTVTELEGLFGQGPREVARAYAISDALVRDLMQDYGPQLPARLLRNVARGASFDQAFLAATGLTITERMSLFWRRHTLFESWISVLGHPFTLWSLMTALALVAIWKHRRRRAARRREWEQQERLEEQAWEEHRRRYRLH